MTFIIHHRRFGTLTSIVGATERAVFELGKKMNQGRPEGSAYIPYVVEIRRKGMSEYQGFGVTDHYEFVQPDATSFGK